MEGMKKMMEMMNSHQSEKRKIDRKMRTINKMEQAAANASNMEENKTKEIERMTKMKRGIKGMIQAMETMDK